jgi:GTP-binding protein EngB required for normal cell division
VCGEVTVRILLIIIIYESKARKHMLEENFYENRQKRLVIAVKLDVIRRIEAGERQIDVCKLLDLAASTVQCILKNADKIKDENGKKKAKVQLPLDSFLSRRSSLASFKKRSAF